MAQLRFEVHRALPVLPPGADAQTILDEVAQLAISGSAGTDVVQITAPDITDVTKPRCARLRRREHLPATKR